MNDDEEEKPKEDPQKKLLDKILERVCHELGEHCTSVRVFVTYQTEDDNALTAGHTFGVGNHFASVGQIGDWLERQREYVREDARRDCRRDED